MKKRTIYITLGITVLILLLTNPSQKDFTDFLRAKNMDAIGMGTGRVNNFLIFSIYLRHYDFDRKVMLIDRESRVTTIIEGDSVVNKDMVRDTWSKAQQKGANLKMSPDDYIADLQEGGDKFVQDLKKANPVMEHGIKILISNPPPHTHGLMIPPIAL